MAAITPVLSLLETVGGAVSAGSAVLGGIQTLAGVGDNRARKQQKQALEQLRRKQDLQQRQLAEKAALEREKIALNARLSEEQRKRALRRAVARKRASFAAQGVGSDSGSSRAVLLGMFDESDTERKKRESIDKIRLSALDQKLSQNNSINILQRTQLAQRQRLQRQFF